MSDEAYLVIREGATWSDVLRLVPGQVITLGRGPSNQVVLKDERCSRVHAELKQVDGQWTIRDLGSRNGTMVGDTLIDGPRALAAGEVIRVGRSQLLFVNKLNEAFRDNTPPSPSVAQVMPSSSVGPTTTTILHRKGQSRLLGPGRQDESGASQLGRAAARLCRLAFELAKSTDLAALADLALKGLFDGTKANAGAVLLLPANHEGSVDGTALEVIAAHANGGSHYHRLPDYLASTVIQEGEAVLARNVAGDSMLGSPDSRGEISTVSVVVAPIRRGTKVLGLIHLYSTESERAPDADDLEFTLAVADTVAVAVENVRRRQELDQDLTQVRTEIVQLRERLGVRSELIGSSAVMRKVAEQIAVAAASRATVLIRGESGVGKELVARAIHFNSARAKNTFVCLNCAALAEDLLASELFGHERGAFTGATERKIGKFEAADRGTLMLDEIGEMGPSLQAKFLRVLEGHPFERVGGNKPIQVDVRVIAATNRDLERDVGEGRFRRDLFFRLRVLEIVVPPLRKRPEDVAELATFFLQRYNEETGRRIKGFSEEALQQLLAYRWPGNVRELKNVVERAVLLSTSDEIEPPDLLLSQIATAGDTAELTPEALEMGACSLADAERKHILAVLEHSGWNKSRTAAILGIERSTLDRKIRRYLLDEARGPDKPA